MRNEIRNIKYIEKTFYEIYKYDTSLLNIINNINLYLNEVLKNADVKIKYKFQDKLNDGIIIYINNIKRLYDNNKEYFEATNLNKIVLNKYLSIEMLLKEISLNDPFYESFHMKLNRMIELLNNDIPKYEDTSKFINIISDIINEYNRIRDRFKEAIIILDNYLISINMDDTNDIKSRFYKLKTIIL